MKPIPLAEAIANERGKELENVPLPSEAREGGQAKAKRAENRASAPPTIISPASFDGRSPPPRSWIVPDWVPSGVVTGLYGDGGVGKSLVALQLQTATALSLPWLGLPVERCSSLGVYCEDDRDELWRRQEDINSDYDVGDGDLRDVHWLPRLGEDNLLIVFGSRGGELTPFHKHLVTQALDLKTRLVIIDTVSDTFGGNENDRGQVRQFVQRGLGSIAQRIRGAVVALAHPSRAGLGKGDEKAEGDGGSTGWSNAFRSRLYFRTPAQETGEKNNPDARLLQRKKANYASREDELRLCWRNGVVVPEALATPSGSTLFGAVDAKDAFLALLDQFESASRPVSANLRSGNFAPRVFANLPREQRHDFKPADFNRAMERLFKAGVIQNIDYGRRSDQRQKIVRVPVLLS